jgi:tetratricopeptide (TPR) repeat protein
MFCFPEGDRGEAGGAVCLGGLKKKNAPSVGLFYYQQARLQYQRQNYPQAVESFHKAIELDPALTDAHLALGQLYYRDQQWDEAIPQFQAVVNADSSQQIAWVSLAEAYLHKNDSKNALVAYEKASAQAPDNLDYRLKMAYIHEKLNNDPGQALSVYRQISFLMETRRIRSENPGLIRERIKTLEASLMKSEKSVAQSDRGLASTPGEKK